LKEIVILDACALIAALREEQGVETVVRLMERSAADEISLRMTRVNLLEVYYDSIKRLGLRHAHDFLDKMQENPIEIIPEISDDALREAGRLKASYRISLADSIGLAEAYVNDGLFVTADHHELDIIEQNESIKFLWIR